MENPILTIDAFTAEAFKGNPAAVCLLTEPQSVAWMQNVAAEMNLSETAFVVPRSSKEDGDGFDLRWFTPTIEIPLCGHATLASAHALWQTERLPRETAARFHTMSGWLTCRAVGERIEMDFPALIAKESELPADYLQALKIEPIHVRRHQRGDGSDGNFLVELASEAAVRAVQPDFERLRRVATGGVIVTARGAGKYDFVSRYFATFAGIDEDPVTGSAHCMLTPYWAERLGKTEMRAFQASARGGEVDVRLAGDRVTLAGQAVTVLRGSLLC